MKTLTIALSLLTFAAQAKVEFLGHVDGISHYLEDVELTDEMKAEITSSYHPIRPATLPNLEEIQLDQIINMSKELWKIIEANKPVVNVKFDYANALPKGLRSSEDLDGFSDVQMKGWRVHGKNLYGITVYDVTYTALHRYGGNLDGKGQYLEDVTILPQHVDVAWAYTLNMNISRVNAVNAGTKEAPVGSVLMQMDLNVKTVVKESQMRHVFQFRGDSAEVVTTSGE